MKNKCVLLGSAAVAALGSSTVWAQATQPVEEVIVTGVRESIAQGLENKREATQVVESIVAEDIGKLPDNNVIEALQRVTGIQVTNRGGGEADPGTGTNPTGFVIRGLPDSTTTWNGRNVFTGVGRSICPASSCRSMHVRSRKSSATTPSIPTSVSLRAISGSAVRASSARS